MPVFFSGFTKPSGHGSSDQEQLRCRLQQWWPVSPTNFLLSDPSYPRE